MFSGNLHHLIFTINLDGLSVDCALCVYYTHVVHLYMITFCSFARKDGMSELAVCLLIIQRVSPVMCWQGVFTSLTGFGTFTIGLGGGGGGGVQEDRTNKHQHWTCRQWKILLDCQYWIIYDPVIHLQCA